MSNGVPDALGGQTLPVWRIPAVQIEKVVVAQVADRIEYTEQWIDHITLSASQSHDVRYAAQRTAEALRSGKQFEQRETLRALDLTIRVFEDRIDASISCAALAKKLLVSTAPATDRIAIELAPTIKNTAQELRMVFPPQNLGRAVVDTKLVELIIAAHRARNALATGDDTVDVNALRRQARFTWLAPDIIVAIIEGRQPVDLTARSLSRIALPLSWTAQRAALGFAPQRN